jgi:hypothetical protein
VTFLVPLVLLAVPLRHVGGPAASAATPVPGGAGYRVVLADRVFRRLLVLSFVASFVGYGQVEGGWTAYANAVARVSTRSIGIAFAVNTAIIVLLQRVVLRRIEGRRRTRMVMLQAVLWAAAWAVLGTAGLVPTTPLAGVLVVGAFGVFAVGETFQSPVLPAIRNDVAPAALRGRYNAAAAIAFQIAHVSGPAVAGALLGRQHADVYIAMLIAGCVALGVAARRLEAVLPPAANGLAAVVTTDDEVPRARRAQDAR